MIESRLPPHRWSAVLLTAAVVLALALRLLGPGAGLPHKDGYAAICHGDEIVYIPLADLTGSPSGDGGKVPPDPCPWFAQFHALPAAEGAPLPATLSLTRLEPPEEPATPILRFFRAFEATGSPASYPPRAFDS